MGCQNDHWWGVTTANRQFQTCCQSRRRQSAADARQRPSSAWICRRDGQIWHTKSGHFFFCSYFPKLLISPVVSILRGILCKCCKNIPSNPSASSTLFIHWNEGQNPVSLHPLGNNMHKFMLVDGKIAFSDMWTSVSNVKLRIPGTHVHLASPVLLCLSSPSTQ